MNEDKRLDISEAHLKECQERLSLLFGVIAIFMDRQVDVTHATIDTLSILAMRVSGALQDVTNDAKEIKANPGVHDVEEFYKD